MSSISGISQGIAAEPLVPPITSGTGGEYSTASTVVSDLQAISSDLQSGDTASAQQTYASLSQLVGSVESPGSTPALTALGTALQSGNTSAASKALTTFAQNLVGILQKFATNHAGHPGAVKQIDNLISSLESIPGVSTGTAAGATDNTGGSGTSSGSNALNVIA